MSEFRIPPVSPLVGSTVGNFFRIIKQGKVAPRYYHKIVLSFLIVLVLTPLHWLDFLVLRRRIRKMQIATPPVFILGHWRSGTTLLHNLLCRDPQSAYMTTSFSILPNNLVTQRFFRAIIKFFMPPKRPSDNMPFNVDLPQEEGFAFSNYQSNEYYNFFYFPSLYREFYDRAVLHEKLSPAEQKKWFSAYDRLLKKILINSGGNRLIVKNPINTGRIDKLLKMFPEAKFIFISRNPVTVFLSTQLFFANLCPSLWFADTDMDSIDDMILDVYLKLMDDYSRLKGLIPEGNLTELRYEDFEKDAEGELKRIYTVLLNQDFEGVRSHFEPYLKILSDYRKNRYTVSGSVINRVLNRWGRYMELYGYSLPDDIEIVN